MIVKIVQIFCIAFLVSGYASISHKASDLDFIYDTIVENHPGIYNKQDPNFNPNLNKTYVKATQYFVNTSNIIEKKIIIENFTKSFNDTHLWVNWNKEVAINNETKKVQITYLNDYIAWVALPSFVLNYSQENDFNEMLKEVIKLSHIKALVFDLRGNQGGNSEYGIQLINTLFGKEYAEQKRYEVKKLEYVDWRASKDNIKYINTLYDSDKSLELKKILEGMRQSYFKGELYYCEKYLPFDDRLRKEKKNNKIE